MLSKEDILKEIRRLAAENGGKPVGRARFTSATGISEYALTRYWLRFNDAVREAGFDGNQFNGALSEMDVWPPFLDLIRRLGRVPTENDLRHERARDASFPSRGVFRRLGTKQERAAQALAYCRRDIEAWRDVVPMLEAVAGGEAAQTVERTHSSPVGFVYLARGHVGEFKIGRTNLVDRRITELGVAAAVEPTLVHEIKTDDPAGVEAYWHRRFAEKRLRGEWFRLSAADVTAFKRWRRIF